MIAVSPQIANQIQLKRRSSIFPRGMSSQTGQNTQSLILLQMPVVCSMHKLPVLPSAAQASLSCRSAMPPQLCAAAALLSTANPPDHGFAHCLASTSGARDGLVSSTWSKSTSKAEVLGQVQAAAKAGQLANSGSIQPAPAPDTFPGGRRPLDSF